jgi:selenophosphate synthase
MPESFALLRARGRAVVQQAASAAAAGSAVSAKSCIMGCRYMCGIIAGGTSNTENSAAASCTVG